MPSPCRVARRSAEIGKDGTLEARRRGPDPWPFLTKQESAAHPDGAPPSDESCAMCALVALQAGRQAQPGGQLGDSAPPKRLSSSAPAGRASRAWPSPSPGEGKRRTPIQARLPSPLQEADAKSSFGVVCGFGAAVAAAKR